MTCFINHSCRLSLSIISLLATTSPRQCYPVINLWHVGLRSLPKFRPDSGQDFFQVFGKAKGTLLGGIEWAADLTAGVPPECSFFCEAPSSRVGKLGGVCLRFCCANVQPAAGIFARTSLEHGSDSTTSGDLDARLQLLPAFLDCVRACACVCVCGFVLATYLITRYGFQSWRDPARALQAEIAAQPAREYVHSTEPR